MGRKIAIIISILSLLFMSCSSIHGLYIASDEDAIGYWEEQLLIKRNHSFVYYPSPLDVGGSIYDSTIGEWKRNNNFLILNSSFQDTSKLYIQEVMDATLSYDSVRIKVFDMITKEPIEKFSVMLWLNDSLVLYDVTNEYGVLNLSKNILFKQLSFPRISTRYSLFNEKNNLLVIGIKQDIYCDFINESFEIKKGKLIQMDNNEHVIEYIRK